MTEGFFFGRDYLSLPRDPHPWIVKDLIPVGGAVNVFGRPKTGKSFAALGIAHAVSQGVKFWLDPKFEVVRKGRVAYFQIDTPRSLWTERLDKIESAGYDLNGIAFADTITAPYPYNILLPEHQEWLKKKIQDINPILTVIDTLREVHSGDENDSTVMKNVISALVACMGSSALLLVSHSRKENQNGEDIMTDARGSSYIAGRMDTVVKLTAKHLLFKGRAIGEGKIKVMQHPQHGLIIPDEGQDQLAQAIAFVCAENPTLSVLALAKKVVEMVPGVSLSTVQRKIAKFKEGQ